MDYQRIVLKGPDLPYYYMIVQLDFGSENSPSLDATQLQFLFKKAVCALYGQVGEAQVKVDVLKYQTGSQEAILRVTNSGFVQLWSALSIITTYNGCDCAVRIKQVSPHLIGLSAQSRTYQHEPIKLEADR